MRDARAGGNRSFRTKYAAGQWLWLVLVGVVGCLPEPQLGALGALPSPSVGDNDAGAEAAGTAASPGAGLDASAALDGRSSRVGCRPASVGELALNEVGMRPSGLDLDGDGASTTRDEYVELVSLASEPVDLVGSRLLFRGHERGRVLASTCLAPRHAALFVGSTSGPFIAPAGAVRVVLDHTLRLSDGGGDVALAAGDGALHDAVSVPAAPPTGAHVWARRADGDRLAPWAAHGAFGPGLAHSPGRCLGGELHPNCVTWVGSRPKTARPAGPEPGGARAGPRSPERREN